MGDTTGPTLNQKVVEFARAKIDLQAQRYFGFRLPTATYSPELTISSSFS